MQLEKPHQVTVRPLGYLGCPTEAMKMKKMKKMEQEEQEEEAEEEGEEAAKGG